MSIQNTQEVVIKPVNDEYNGSNSSILSYLNEPLLVYQDYNQIKMVEKKFNRKRLIIIMKKNYNFLLADIESDSKLFVDTIEMENQI